MSHSRKLKSADAISIGLLMIFLSFRRYINVIDFVLKLRKLFRSKKEKESLFTEIRELVDHQDLGDYDRMVYRLYRGPENSK